MHLLSASGSVKGGSVGGRSAKSEGTETIGGKSKAKSIAPSIPEHKIKFEEFHNQVRWRVPGCWEEEVLTPASLATARRSHLYRLHRSSRERSHDGAFLSPLQREIQLTPRFNR